MSEKAHVLPDVLAPDLDVVFCGTAASRMSAARGYNYGNPGNLFWPTLMQLDFVPAGFDPAAFRTLPQFGLGLTDLCKTGIGNDDEPAAQQYDRAALLRKIRRYQPRWLAMTSKTAGSILLGYEVSYGLQADTIGATPVFVLPSTSGRARRFFDIGWWQDLRQKVRLATVR